MQDRPAVDKMAEMTWDERAIAFASNIETYFQQEWMNLEGPRRTQDRPAVDKMAEMSSTPILQTR